MITGHDPLIIFTFNVPLFGIPFLVVPIPLNEDNTGLVEKKVDSGITIATETVGANMIQKSYSDSLSIEFAAKKDSMFATMIVPLLKKVFTSANITDLTFGLVSGGFNYSNNYNISYFSGNQYVVGGMLTAFDYGNQDNTDLINVSMTISAPPALASAVISSDTLQKTTGTFINTFNSAQTAASTVTTAYNAAPQAASALLTAGSIDPYPEAE
jgi:hypothetical protein